MEIELNTLLVALMFVTILSMGIGNILMTLADILNNATSSRRDRLHIGWIALVLMVHFSLFWNTKAIIEVKGFEFGGFLMTMAGPVLLFFATAVLLTSPSEVDEADLRGFFRRLGRRFFLMFAAVQVWLLLTAFALSGTLYTSDFANVFFLVLALVLALNTNPRVHIAGMWLAWIVGLTALGLRWYSSAG